MTPLFAQGLNRTRLLLLCVLLFCPALARSAELMLAVHPPPQIAELSLNEARAIFSMRLKTWPDGTPITVYVLSRENPEHHRFVRTQLKLLPHQLQRNWDRMVYTGIGQAPIEVNNFQEMLHSLLSKPGSIGYLPAGMQNEELLNVTVH